MRLSDTSPTTVLQTDSTAPGQFFELLEGMTTGMDNDFASISLALLDAQDQLAQTLTSSINQYAQAQSAISEAVAAAYNERASFYAAVAQFSPSIDYVYEPVASACQAMEETLQSFACQSVAPAFQGVEENLQTVQSCMEEVSATYLATSTLLQEAAEREAQVWTQLAKANSILDQF